MTDGELLERFIGRRDEAAFESVVLRYGPMVLRVCRDVLGDGHDAEDAFQATFLVLVRNARAIRDRESLGRWLYEVAYRVSLRARAQAGRRRVLERQGVEMAAAVDDSDAARSELRPLIHAELARLPEKYRVPLVLCYFEGLTQDDAARRLRCPLGTLKSRLTRGREILRSRLGRRGLAVTAMLLMLLLNEDASAELDERLVAATVAAGLSVVDGRPAECVATPRVARLAEPLPRRQPRPRFERDGAVIAVLIVIIAASSVRIARSTPVPRLSTVRALLVGDGGSCHASGLSIPAPTAAGLLVPPGR